MKRVHLNACLLACLMTIMSSCKKDISFEKNPDVSKVVELGDLSAKKDRCLTDERMEILYHNRLGYQSQIIEGRQITMNNLEKSTSRNLADLPLLTIPVHIIIVHRNNDPIGNSNNISTDRIHSQIAALNRDFLRKNTDAAKTPPIFQVSNSQIQFCLASVDPAGKPTTGITRYATNQNFDNNELSIKRKTGWDPGRYLNIWVAHDIDALGYAYLPTPLSLPHPDEDGVVVLTEVFGGPNSGATAPFNLGRTLTHEVGHYLGLDHIWGDGCRVDDGISDTPNQAEENYDCPTHPSPSCNNQGDMFMNYMDYTDDVCMNAFTSGQVAYMRTILATSRAQLVQPGRTNCPTSGTPVGPTCQDGIKNGDETGVDCGGSCPPCQTVAAADAGIVNLTYTVETVACNPVVRLKANMTNYGTAILTSVAIEVSTPTQKIVNYQWTGTLASKANVTVSLPSINLAVGSYQLTASTKNPNGKPDGNPANDKVSLGVSVKGSTKLTLVIKPDDYAGDISWKIKDASGKDVRSGGGYEDFNRSTIRETICLPEGCYRLIMKDSYGDGICCDYGRGWYELRDGSGVAILESDGYYGYSETQWFCLDASNNLSREKVEREPKISTSSPRTVTRTNPEEVKN